MLPRVYSKANNKYANKFISAEHWQKTRDTLELKTRDTPELENV